jgi:hypothetical protein
MLVVSLVDVQRVVQAHVMQKKFCTYGRLQTPATLNEVDDDNHDGNDQ